MSSVDKKKQQPRVLGNGYLQKYRRITDMTKIYSVIAIYVNGLNLPIKNAVALCF